MYAIELAKFFVDKDRRTLESPPPFRLIVPLNVTPSDIFFRLPVDLPPVYEHACGECRVPGVCVHVRGSWERHVEIDTDKDKVQEILQVLESQREQLCVGVGVTLLLCVSMHASRIYACMYVCMHMCVCLHACNTYMHTRPTHNTPHPRLCVAVQAVFQHPS